MIHDKSIHASGSQSVIVHHSNPSLRPVIVGWLRAFAIDAVHVSHAPDLMNQSWSRPDLVIAGGESGADFVKAYRLIHPRCPFIFHVEDENAATAVWAFKIGTSEVLLGDLDRDKLIDAAIKVLGLRRATRRAAQSMPAFDTLTQREREVAKLIAEGMTNKEAAATLGISPRTVEVHRARAMEKYHARNAAEFVRKFLFPPPPPN